MLKLKVLYFGHLMQTLDSLEKSLIMGKVKGRRKRGHQRMRCLDDITNGMNMNLGKLRKMMRDREACPWGHKKLDTSGQLNNSNTVGSVFSCCSVYSDLVPDFPLFPQP